MKTIFTFVCLLILCGCIRKPDFSNPKDVVANYQNLINNGKIEKAFTLVSDSSKNILTFQDFQDFYDLKFVTSIRANFYIIEDIKQMPIDPNFPDYRSFEFKEVAINKISKDSTIKYYYLRARNQGKEGWHVVWTKHLERVAMQLEEKSKYDDAIRVCDKILHHDPYNGDAYQIKAWIYFRQDNNRMLEQSGTKVLDLEPKDPQSHVIMAAIFDTKGLYESAKLSNQKALLFTNDPEEISQILSNTSINCESLNQPDSAIYYLKKANSNSIQTHALWRLANIFDKINNPDSSIYYFNKALVNKPMDNYLQVQLYCDYADFLLRYTKSLSNGSVDQKAVILKAKNIILKALDLDPNDSVSKLLLDKIKNL